MEYDYFIPGPIIISDLVTLILQQEFLYPTYSYTNTLSMPVDDVEGTQVQIIFNDVLSEEAVAALVAVISGYSDISQLKTAVTSKVNDIRNSINGYLESHYSSLNRMNLFNLYVLAQFDSLHDRANYIRPGIDWFMTVTSYGLTLIATVRAMTNVSSVQAFIWDIDAHVPSDPGVRLSTALGILT